MAVVKLQVSSNFKEASADLSNLGTLTEKEAKRIKTAMGKLEGKEFDSFIQKNKRAGAAVTAFDGKLAGLEKQQAGLKRQIQSLINAGFDPEDEALTSLRKEYDKTTNAIETNTKVTKLQEQAVSAAKKAIVGIAATLGAGAFASIKFASAIEDATAAFTPLVGGTEKATELVQLLNETAATTPFQFENISAAAKQLLPVMKGDLEKTVDTFRMLGDTAGGNAQKLESVTRGYTKAMLKNKVDMESLNMIAEAGVPIYTELADSMGVSVAEMTAMSAAGTITADDLTAAFQSMTDEGGIFYDGMTIASQTLSGKWSTLQDNAKILAATFGDKLLPAVKDIVDKLISAAQAVTVFVQDGEKFEKMTNIVIPAIFGITAALATFVIGTKIAQVGVAGLARSFVALTTAMLANPLTWIALAIGVVIAGIVLLIKNWDKVVVIMSTTVQKLKVQFELFASTMSTAWTRAVNGLIQVFLKLGGIILEKVLGAVNKLLTLASKIPFVGEKFANLQENVNGFAAELETARLEAIANSKAAVELANTEQQAAKDKAATSIAAIKEESIARLAALKEQEELNSKMETTATIPGVSDVEDDGTTTGDDSGISALSERLNAIAQTENMMYNTRLATFGDFLTSRMELEGVEGEARITFLQDELSRIQELENISNEEKLSAEKAVQDKITAIQKEALDQRKELINAGIDSAMSLASSISTIMRNLGNSELNAIQAQIDAAEEGSDAKIRLQEKYNDKAKKLQEEQANREKVLGIASATISTAQAIIGFLANPGGIPGLILSGMAAATGAAQIAAIATTPIGSAETGGSFTVPTSSGAQRADNKTIAVSEGETVNVSPRGESSGQSMTANFVVNEDVLWSITQRGIDSNNITFTNDNLRAG